MPISAAMNVVPNPTRTSESGASNSSSTRPVTAACVAPPISTTSAQLLASMCGPVPPRITGRNTRPDTIRPTKPATKPLITTVTQIGRFIKELQPARSAGCTRDRPWCSARIPSRSRHVVSRSARPVLKPPSPPLGRCPGQPDRRRRPTRPKRRGRASRPRRSGSRVEDGHQDRAGDGGAERRAEVGDAAREPGDLALLLLGEARLHEVDRRRQHHAQAEPDQQQPGREAPRARRGVDQGEQQPDAGDGDDEAGEISVRCAWRLASRSAASDETRRPTRRRGEDHAGLDRVVVAHHLQEHRDDERHAHQQQPLEVLGGQRQVGGAVAEQGGRQQRLLARSLRARM